MTKIVRWALCMAAGLASVGIASAREGAAPLDPVQVEARRAYANRLLLDKLGDQTYLVQLEKEFRVSQEGEHEARSLARQIEMRVQAGVARRVDVELVGVALAEAQIGMQGAAATLQAVRLRYLARYGAPCDTAIPAPKWGDRLPKVEGEFLARLGEADRTEGQIAWARARRAQTVAGLQKDRAKSLVEVARGFEQQFAIGQVTLGTLIAAQQAVRRAEADVAAAEREVILAQAALLGWEKTLTDDDLFPVAKRGWSFDPDAPPPPKPSAGLGTVGTSGTTASVHRPGKGEWSGKPVKPPRADDKTGRIIRELESLPSTDQLEPAAAGPAQGPTIVAGVPPVAATPPPSPGCSDDPPGLPTARIHGLPVFDPGPPSSEEKIPQRLLRADEGATTLGSVARRMVSALDEARYEYSFLAVGTQGFALVTRMEQFRPDGAPSPARWSREPPRVGELGLMEFIQALFRAPPGQYRVIALVVSDEARERGGADRGEGRFDALFDCGANRLPQALAVVPFTANTRADALVYEFAKPSANARASLVEHPRRDAHFHLVKAGIWDALNGE